jgi:hypothetical protein
MSNRFVIRRGAFGRRICVSAVLCALVLLAVALPRVEAADQQSKTFALSVVGPDGKAVPDIAVEVRGEPPVRREQIREGRFLRQGKNGMFARSTANGRLVLELPANLNRFDVLIETPGYAPYWARWNSDEYPEPVPLAFRAELSAAWSVGGVVVDGDGKPVEGARVTPRIRYKLRPDDFRGSYFGSHVTTDAKGRWRFDSVPASQDDVVVLVDHADFVPQEHLATRREFGLDHGRNPSASILLRRGLTVKGKVTDETGKAIAGAVLRTGLHDTIRRAVTGLDGCYRLCGCEPGPARVVVSAKGHAMDMQTILVASDMEPVNFQMNPGGKVRVRVVDEHDKPIPRFHLLFQSWLGGVPFFEFADVNPVADDRGVWEWRDATLDVFAADIICPGHATLSKQEFVARRDEFVFRPPPALIVSGRVVDRETKLPVRRFLVEWGRDMTPNLRPAGSYRLWAHAAAFSTADGRYCVPAAQNNLNRDYIVSIEADGYEPPVSRPISGDRGNVAIDFELTKGKSFDATILMPDGQHPAASAKVEIEASHLVPIRTTNGELETASAPWHVRETDVAGRVHFPPQDQNSYLVVTHASGYAIYQPWPKSNRRTIVLDPWTRVEGTYRVGGKPLAGIPITIRYDDRFWPRRGNPRVAEDHHTTTGADGRFAFERVMAGRGTITRNLLWNAIGWVSSTSGLEANFPLGKTVRVDIEEKGRPLIGSLRPPAGMQQKVDWQSAVVELTLQTNGDAPKSHFTAAVSPDGSFRTDSLPGGMYSLDVRFRKAGPGHVWDRPVILSANDNDRESTAPLDLGVVTLEKD